MSLSVNSYVFLGIVIHYEDLFRETGGQKKCNRGHTVPETSHFCSECGAPAGVVRKYEPTEEFATYCGLSGYDPDDLFNNVWGDVGEQIGSGFYLEIKRLRPNPEDPHPETDSYVLGVKLMECGQYGARFRGFPLASLMKAQEKLKTTLSLLGMSNRPVQVVHALDIS